MSDADDDAPCPLPRNPSRLREALIEIVVTVAQEDLVSGRTPVAVTDEVRRKTAEFRHRLFGEEIGEIPFDADEERKAQASQAAATRAFDRSLLAAILSNGFGEA